MGTETTSLQNYKSLLFHNRVKLNNPQMGTETSNIILPQSRLITQPVKLNNPQMGTETCSYSMNGTQMFCKKLN